MASAIDARVHDCANELEDDFSYRPEALLITNRQAASETMCVPASGMAWLRLPPACIISANRMTENTTATSKRMLARVARCT